MPHRDEREIEILLRGIHQRLDILYSDPKTLSGSDPVRHIIIKLERLEQLIMTTAAEMQAKMDALRDEVAAEKTVEDSAVSLLTGLITQITALQAQIAALQAAGAGAITQAQLDALGAEADTVLTSAQANIKPLADAVAANTTPPPAAPASPA